MHKDAAKRGWAVCCSFLLQTCGSRRWLSSLVHHSLRTATYAAAHKHDMYMAHMRVMSRIPPTCLACWLPAEERWTIGVVRIALDRMRAESKDRHRCVVVVPAHVLREYIGRVPIAPYFAELLSTVLYHILEPELLHCDVLELSGSTPTPKSAAKLCTPSATPCCVQDQSSMVPYVALATP